MKSRYISPSLTFLTWLGTSIENAPINSRTGMVEKKYSPSKETVSPAALVPQIFTARVLDKFGGVLPELPRAELGIEESLDQRGFGLFLCKVACILCAEVLFQEM